MSSDAFDFGKNWKEFSAHALDAERYAEARRDFATLFDGIDLAGRDFLDIGFGQGLSLLCAERAGARTVGVDLNPTCREVLQANRVRLEPESSGQAAVIVGSILDPAVVTRLAEQVPGGYDVVHSWGVLHHTGAMWPAIEQALSLVRPGGHLVLALYNRHWTSPAWTLIKRVYVAVPGPLQRLLNWLFVPVIYLAKLLVTRRNPLAMERGMDFYYNVVDWIGGYPYEYASRTEVEAFLGARGFGPCRYVQCVVPIGCNEFVFRRG